MPTLRGDTRALHYAVENRRGRLILIKFIWPEARNEWVAASPGTRVAVGTIERMGADDRLYDLEPGGHAL